MHILMENKIQVYTQNTYNNMFRQLKKMNGTSQTKYSKNMSFQILAKSASPFGTMSFCLHCCEDANSVTLLT